MAVHRVRNGRPIVVGHKFSSSSREPMWFRLLKPLFIALFTVMFFILVYSTSHHGFFSGGPYTTQQLPARSYAQ